MANYAQQIKALTRNVNDKINKEVFRVSKEVVELAKKKLRNFTEKWYKLNPEPDPEIYERTYDFINSIEGKVTQSRGKYYIKVYYNSNYWTVAKRGFFYSHADLFGNKVDEDFLISYIENGSDNKIGTKAIIKTIEWLERNVNNEFQKRLKIKIGRK